MSKFLLDLDPLLMEIPHGKLRNFLLQPHGPAIALFSILSFVSIIALSITFWYKPHHLMILPNQKFIAIVKHDSAEQKVPTDARTVGELLGRLNVQIGPHDRVEPATDQAIDTDNMLINVYRSAPVAIVENNHQTLVNSAAATPRSVVTQSGMILYPEDEVKASLTTNFLTQKSLGYRTTIDRSAPVRMQLYGQPIDLRTRSNSVKDLLKEKNIKLTKDDTVRPALSTPLTANMAVTVVRNGIQTATINEDTPFPIQNIIDGSLSFGTQALRQEGVPGKVANTYEIKVENGVEVGRRLLQSVKISDPVPRIIAKGNTVNIPSNKQAIMAAAGISPSDYGYVDYIFSHESRWNAAALNSRGCGGLGQACPSSKMAASCPNWQNDPVCQTRWFSGYAGRYGGWAGAYNAWVAKHWW